MKTKLILGLVAIIAWPIQQQIEAHDGRRFDVTVIDNQLYAQGYLSGANPINDGGGIERPYFNAIHGHFSNTNSGAIAIADLPGFDIRMANASELQGFDLTLTLIGSGKWDSPPPQDGTGLDQDFGVPQLVDLAVGETIFAFDSQTIVSTDAPGALSLATGIDGDVLDIDLNYEINVQPVDSIHFIEWELSTSNPDIESSSSIYTILSPDGVGPVQRLHFQSLALEQSLGVTLVAVPEPSSMVCLAFAASCLMMVRKRK